MNSRISAADRNFVASFEKLVANRPGAELRRFGAAIAFDSRIPIRIFNGLAVLEAATPSDVRDALTWLDGRGVPSAAWVRQELLHSVLPTLLDARLEQLDWPEPVMGIEPPDDVPAPPDGVSVREVVDEAMLEDHIRSNAGGGFPEEPVRMLYTPDFLADPDIRMFNAYDDDGPVGHSIAIRSDDVSGVYGVGVPERMRRRGIGSAVTWAAVQAGRDWGCHLVVLQSSTMGYEVYRRMGFEVLTHYVMFRVPMRE